MASRKVLVAVVIAIVLAAPVASAAPTAAQRETARRLMDEGKERARVGDKDRALEAYQKAHDLMKVPTVGTIIFTDWFASAYCRALKSDGGFGYC